MKRPQREFHAMGEVCRLFDVKPHVLRYWEEQFPSLAPAKSRAGNRVYRAADLELIALIRHLLHEERFTVEGARRRIEELRAGGEVADAASGALQRAFLRSLRGELEEIHVLLGPVDDATASRR